VSDIMTSTQFAPQNCTLTSGNCCFCCILIMRI